MVGEKDFKGILHVHSDYSDGAASIAELSEITRKMGYSYLGIADHSQAAAYAGGMKPADVKRQHQEIDQLNKKLKGFYIDLLLYPEKQLIYNQT